MNPVDENTRAVALQDATAEVRTLIEDLTRLSEELKLREERLGELLAPSEAALTARTEYLDHVMREQLGRAEERVLKLGREVEGIARHLNDRVVQMPSRLAEVFSQHWGARERREMWRTVLCLTAMLLGGFLAVQVANWRSGKTTSVGASSAGTSGERSEERLCSPAPASAVGHEIEPPARTLTREAIARSADLQRRYALEYASMLRVVSDREVAKEAARVNLSALLLGGQRIVALEGRLNAVQLRDAIGRGGEDLVAIRRAISSLVSPEMSRVPPRRIGHLGPQR